MPRKQSFTLLALALALLVATPAGSALVAPVLTGPDDGATVDALPAFTWNAVAGASTYGFEFSADPGFNSLIAQTSTKNTRATLKTVIPNGTYYWRVRALPGTGPVGAWSEVRSLEMAWEAGPALQAPAEGATITYPSEPLELKWANVPGASEYLVRVATDPDLGSLLWDGEPIETAGTAFTLNDPLAPGTYYWGISPLNAQGHEGEPSAVRSFTWSWPSTTTPAVMDLVAADEVYDPQFSWDLVPGAAGYEVEVNFSSDWTESSKVCCEPIGFASDASTLGTSLSPDVMLENNTYFWRVRAIDASGNAGVWNAGPSFTKTFDNVPPVTAPSVKSVRMRDNLADPATDTDGGTTVVDTDVPIVVWDPVPGASGYQVNVTAYAAGICDWTSSEWDKETAVTAWTPLGWAKTSGTPYSPWTASNDGTKELTEDQEYCVRVRAVDRTWKTGGPVVRGDWTYLPASNAPAFRWNGPAASSSCTPCTMVGASYGAPLTGASVGTMPLFTWTAPAGAESFYVLVARDPNFTNVVDFAYTRIPAYAPREANGSIAYADETTLYYWAVLPADNPDGSGVAADPLGSAAQSFTKQSTPPTLIGPIDDELVTTPTTVFRWSPVDDAGYYRIQVAQDPTFSVLQDNVRTDSASYTSNKTYPSDTLLYWRVRAEAENGNDIVALSWSSSGTFSKQLAKPVLDPGNPTSGSFLPTVKWSTVPGAVSYDLRLVEPDGDLRTFTEIPAPAGAFTEMTGVGVFTWQVRANFPTNTSNVVPGPYSVSGTFTHTLPEPSNPAEEAGQTRLLLSWDPRPRADKYRVQVSTRADFATSVENTTTETTSYAPLLTSPSYTSGGTFHWRVAMIDVDNNQGDFTGVRSFALPAQTGGGGPAVIQRFRVTSAGKPVRKRSRKVILTVRNTSFQAVQGARVRVSGAGVRAATKVTGSAGKVAFRIRAKRYPGTVSFRITKTGFTSTTYKRSVRLR